MKHISPINDFFFRYLFGMNGHQDLTLNFINSVLTDLGMGPLQKVVIKNPFNVKESVTDKESILDIKAEDEDNRVYDIEMQLSGNALFANRSLYYWSKCYTSQISESDDYQKLNPVICINVVNFRLFEQTQRVHHCFLLKEHTIPDMVLTDHLMIHFLGLTEFRTMGYTKCNHLADWLTWFIFEEENMKGLDSIMERNPAIKKAHRLYEIFTADKELMEKYEARQKYLRDVSTIKGVSHDEGFAKGREEGEQIGIQKGEQIGIQKGEQIGIQKGEQIGIQKGREENLHQVVLSMHQKGFELPTIAEITGLTREQIKEIITIGSL